MSTHEKHRVNGTLFAFPELPPEDSEPVRKARLERDSLLAWASKPRKHETWVDRVRKHKTPPHGVGKFVPRDGEPGSEVSYTVDGEERTGIVWSKGPNGTRWVTSDSETYGVMRLVKDGVVRDTFESVTVRRKVNPGETRGDPLESQLEDVRAKLAEAEEFNPVTPDMSMEELDRATRQQWDTIRELRTELRNLRGKRSMLWASQC